MGKAVPMSKDKIATPTTISLVAIVLAVSVFSLACSDAAAPQPVSGPTAMTTTANKRSAASQEAIKNVMDVPIAKLDGSTFKLADYHGKVLVVDFWATFCPPCVKQVPHLAAMNEKYRDRGLQVVGLTAYPKEDQQQVEDFIKKFGMNYTVAYDNSWIASAFLKGTEDESGSPPIPQLFVIGRDGRVVEHFIGEQPGRMDQLEKVVTEQLSASR
jgi:peroxiredoxin